LARIRDLLSIGLGCSVIKEVTFLSGYGLYAYLIGNYVIADFVG
jgi:hypothetical protein